MDYLSLFKQNSEKVKVLVLQSCPTLCNPIDCSPQASLSMGFPRQEYWSILPFPSPRDIPDPGIEPRSLELQAYSSPSKPTGKPKPQREVLKLQKIKKSHVTKYYLFNYYSLHSAFNGFNLTSYPTFRMNKSFLSLNVMWLCVCVCVRACVRVCVC